MSPKNCPHCGIVKKHFIKWGKTPQKRIRYRCSDCHKTFTNRTGTIRHRSHLNDRDWQTVSKMLALRTCPSGADIGRLFGKNRKTGQSILRSLRQFIPPSQIGLPLSGVVEVDESTMQKQWIVGLKSRKTKKIKLFPVLNRDMKTLENIIDISCTHNATILSDEWKGYALLKYKRPHYTICHSKEFVSKLFPEIHTQSIEGVWGSLKPRAKHTHRGYHNLKSFLNISCFLHNFSHYERERFFLAHAFPHFTNIRLV